MVAVVIVVVVVVLVALVAVIGFNKLRSSDVRAQEALGGIDVQLTRRAELVPNLVSTVKGYAAHEAGVLEEVTRARTGVETAAQGDDVPAKAAADQAMTSALVKVDAVAEQYPDLKASTAFLDLQHQLAETEVQLAGARQRYNAAVGELNTATRTIPWQLFVGMAGVRAREFYEAPEGQQAAPTVDFS